MNKTQRIAVIGAGISGLSTAYWLKKEGYEVEVFEKSSRAGGALFTVRDKEYVIELGANSTLETSEVLTQLISDLGLDKDKIYANEISNTRYVLKDGELHPVPMSPLAFFKTPLFSLRTKLNLFTEPFKKPTRDPEISLADFVRYRLGNEFLDYAINPFVAGVYAGDPEQLSTAAGFPKLYALEQKYGSLIMGAIRGARERKKRKEVAKDRAKMFSFVNGMSSLPEALMFHLEENVHFNTTIVGLQKDEDNRFTISYVKDKNSEQVTYDQVVLTVPAHFLSGILGPMSGEVSAKLNEVDYPPVSVVFTVFKKEDVGRALDGFGYLIPEKEGRQILGSIWNSVIFPGRAPQDEVVFTTFVGGTRQPGLAKGPSVKIEKMVVEELAQIMKIEGDPVYVYSKTWSKAIPQYKVGYSQLQNSLDELEKHHPGLHFAGNYRRGISVGDSVLSAHETVNRIRHYNTGELQSNSKIAHQILAEIS